LQGIAAALRLRGLGRVEGASSFVRRVTSAAGVSTPAADAGRKRRIERPAADRCDWRVSHHAAAGRREPPDGK